MAHDFDFDNSWTLSGQLQTAHAVELAAWLTDHFGVKPHDPIRECRLTVHAEAGTLGIFLRQDALTGGAPESLPADCLRVAPDATGVLRFEWPYVELQEGAFPEDWRFRGWGRVAIFGYHLTPDDTPRTTYGV